MKGLPSPEHNTENSKERDKHPSEDYEKKRAIRRCTYDGHGRGRATVGMRMLDLRYSAGSAADAIAPWRH